MSMRARTSAALLWALLVAPGIAVAQESLLAAFPAPEIVDEKITRADAVETAIWRVLALDTLGAYVETVVPRPAEGPWNRSALDLQSRYWQYRWKTMEPVYPSLAGGRKGQDAERQARAEMERRLMLAAQDPTVRTEVLRIVNEQMLTDDLRERIFGPGMRTARMNDLRARMLAVENAPLTVGGLNLVTEYAATSLVQELPESWQGPAMKIVDIPAIIWLSLLVLWFAFGISRAGRAFGFDEKEPDVFRNGSERMRISAQVGRVIQEKTSQIVQTSTSYTSVTDAQGFTRSIPSTSVHTTGKQRIHVLRPDGRETDIDLTNFELPVREGHLVLDAAAFSPPNAKSGPYVFFHIYEMDRTVETPALRNVTKFRPRAFIPFFILSLWVGVAFLGVLGLLIALVAAPIVYGITMSVLNGRRLRKFREEFMPQIIEAARLSEPAGVSRG